MKTKKLHIIFISTGILLPVSTLPVQADDSIPEHTLKEVTVKGERGWIEGGVMNFIPTKSEKRLSNSPASLIGAMHLPMLSDKDGIITNMFGDEVPVFINGEKAENIDISTFWTSDVKRVQYIEHPTQSNYEGLPAVVNFIMSEYEFGGVSRAELRQRLPNDGDYEVASKFVYKRMSYGALLDAQYSRDHSGKAANTTSYRNLIYDGKFYDEITNKGKTRSYERSNKANLTLNAKYTDKKFKATHTFSLGWNRNPGSGSRSIDEWTENIFSSDNSETRSTSKSISPSLSGKYWSKFSDKWYLTGTWHIKHSHNSNYSLDRIGHTAPVENMIKEDVTSLDLSLKPSFYPSEKWVFQLKTQASFDRFSSKYAGSADVSQLQSRQRVMSSILAYWELSERFSINVEPGFLLSSWQIGDASSSDFYPTISTSYYWAPCRKLYISGTVSFMLSPVSAFESNPVMIRTSELLWSKGNPHLSDGKVYYCYIHSTWLASDKFSISLGSNFERESNVVIPTYMPASPEMGGLVRSLVNAQPTDNLFTHMKIQSYFFDSRLSVSIGPNWRYTRTRGSYANKLNQLGMSASIDYTFGNCSAEVTYLSPFKSLEAAGSERYWQQGSCVFSFIYGTDSFHLKLKLDDVLNKRKRYSREYMSPDYGLMSYMLGTGRRATISLTYTIGYGKKIDRNIDIDSDTSTKSSIMDTSK